MWPDLKKKKKSLSYMKTLKQAPSGDCMSLKHAFLEIKFIRWENLSQ